MNLVERILTRNPCYTAGQKINVQGLMLHSVGCAQPNAMVFINAWDSPNYGSACVHGFIDGNDGTVYQTLPWNHRGWHGGGQVNNTHIGVEMCEPATIRYSGGASFVVLDRADAVASATRTYNAAVELFAYLCKMFNLNPMTQIISHNEGGKMGIASGHVDPEHLWNGLGMGYTMDTFRAAVKAKMNGTIETDKPVSSRGTQAKELANLSNEAIVEKVGPLFTADMKKTGILASVSMAQFILESAYGKSELAQNANNCFGMKQNLSGNNWSGSTWDGKSTYTKQTAEQDTSGVYTSITAAFRKYACIEDSIADHSAYLLGAKNGNQLRYAGLKGEKIYQKAFQIIKDGGYATSLAYVMNLCAVVEKWNLTKWDDADIETPQSSAPYQEVVPHIEYEVKNAYGYKSSGKDGSEVKMQTAITGIRIGVDIGTVKYRVHCNGEWLPSVYGNDWNDFDNGYAGDDVHAIDALQIYYYSDTAKTDFYEAVYAIQPFGMDYLPEVYDTNWEPWDGDNTAGMFGFNMQSIYIKLRKC